VCACVLQEVGLCMSFCVFVCEALCVSLFEVGLYVVMFHACASGYVCCFVYV